LIPSDSLYSLFAPLLSPDLRRLSRGVAYRSGLRRTTTLVAHFGLAGRGEGSWATLSTQAGRGRRPVFV